MMHRFFSTARALLLTVIAICAALVTTFVFPSGLAQATATFDPEATTTLKIHKFEQPSQPRHHANGLPQDTTGLAPIPGVTFSATRVPEIDLTTNIGQHQAGQMTVSEAADRVAEVSITAQGVTNANGTATLEGLEAGLYYIREHNHPAGYSAAAPMVIALPLTHPQSRDRWLDTVHVYPKSAPVDIGLEVRDQAAVTLGDPVDWVARATIPPHTGLDFYRVDALISDHVHLVGQTSLSHNVNVRLDCHDCPALTAGRHYSVHYSQDTRRLTLEFLEAGLQQLAYAVARDPAASIRLEYTTVVEAAGHHTNEVFLYTSRDAAETGQAISASATTKWGPLSIRVHAVDDPQYGIAGAHFQLYLSLEDALARRNPIEIDGTQEWGTDEDGRFVVDGLRFSGFVNGLDRPPEDELYRYYWAVPVTAPEGWQWVDQTPAAGSVVSTSEKQTLVFKVQRLQQGQPLPSASEQPHTHFPDEPSAEPASQEKLPMTGAQILGALIFATVLVLGGLILLRRRRETSPLVSVDE